MKLSTGLILTTLLTLLPQISRADYFVAVPTGQGVLDTNRSSLILVSGRGTNQRTQFRMSAMTTARLFQRNFTGEQVVLISVIEREGDSLKKVKAAGWRIVGLSEKKLMTETVMQELLKFPHIRALEFFGHNSASLGTQTDGPGARFDAREAIVRELASHFTADAFAIFHGCNTGWMVAEDLAKKWMIPVSGSFTETNFEELSSDGHFYTNDPGKHPKTSWASANKDLGTNGCAMGGCIRMRPSPIPYNSDWGDLSGPFLSHYKFFCHLGEKECERRMALSLYGFVAEKSLSPNSSKDDFRKVVQQFLCPAPKDRLKALECENALNLVESGTGNPFVFFNERNFKQLSCDLHECKAKLTCDDEHHVCHAAKRVSDRSQTLTQEYLHYMNGFDELKGSGLQ